MSPFWATVLGTLVTTVVVAVVGFALAPWIFDRLARCLVRPLLRTWMRDPYGSNLFSVATTLQRFGPRVFVETLLRAQQGKALERPFGSVRQVSPWGAVMFAPRYLTRDLPRQSETIHTRTVIGTRAKKPLQLDIPILVSAMSWGGALSEPAKVALARGANLAGTATNSGEGYLDSERREAERLIVQYTRASWPNATQYRPDLLARADAIEIQIGQGAQAAVPQTHKADKIDPEWREAMGLKAGQDAIIDATFERVHSPGELKSLVAELRGAYPVPIGYKFGATPFQEEELDAAIDAEVDYVVVDGAEGGTHGAAVALLDDVGLPTFHALVRTLDHLARRGVRDRVSVIAAGGLASPSEYMKALALGADAVYIASAALVALVSDQFARHLDQPPTDWVLYTGKYIKDLDIDRGAQNLARYLRACVKEMESVARAAGRNSLHAVDRSDLFSLDERIARFARIASAWEPGRPTAEGSPGVHHDGQHAESPRVHDGQHAAP